MQLLMGPWLYSARHDEGLLTENKCPYQQMTVSYIYYCPSSLAALALVCCMHVF